MLPNDIYMGIVYDALRILGEKHEDFYINIKPKAGYKSIIQGPCLTTYGKVVEVDREEYSSMDKIRLNIYKESNFNNKPIVFLQSNDNKVAHSGDITSLIYKRLGAVGFVTDGNVRDVDKIDEINFPTFCEGENPIDALHYWALTKYKCTINIHGVEIKPGDYSFASKDGVIVVKEALLERFKIKATEQLNRENRVRNLICNSDMTLDEIEKDTGRW